jgi:hypothetical protein
MPRKVLGLLLIISWVVLSGFDLLEELGPGNPHEIDSIPDDSPLNNDHRQMVNDIVELAHHIQLYHACLFDLDTIDLAVGSVITFKKVLRLHKLHRVYLI